MSKAELEKQLRTDFIKTISEALDMHYDADVLPISASELVVPVTDAEGNEKFVKVSISIKRGTRNAAGTYDDYDGYGAAEDWKAELERRQNKKDVSAAKKEAAAKEREAKRAARKTIKELNEKGLNKMIHEAEDE